LAIRSELPGDLQFLHSILLDAFPGPDEARLVDRLRDNRDLVYSLVATRDNLIIGYAGFSKLVAPFRALGLAPVAVAENSRRQGVAEALITKGLELARLEGWQGVFVYGNPNYYERFGFSTEMARKYQSPYAGPYLMALGLQTNGLPTLEGHIDYAPAFAGMD
jgi:putative acetyltransferase